MTNKETPSEEPIRFNLKGVFAFALVVSLFLAFHRHLRADWPPLWLLIEVVAFHAILLAVSALFFVYVARKRLLYLALSILCVANSVGFLLFLATSFAPGYESYEVGQTANQAINICGTLGIYVFGPTVSLLGLYHWMFRQT